MISSVMSIDAAAMFRPTVSLLELFIRGSVMYLGILAVMRAFRRQKGAMNAADLLVLLLIADAAQNALSAEYKSLTEGVVVVGTIWFWDYVLDRLAFTSVSFNRMLNGDPILLVRDGKLDQQQMRRVMLSRSDVLEQLREQGVHSLTQVKRCYLETDGHFSVLKEDDDESVRPSHFADGVA